MTDTLYRWVKASEKPLPSPYGIDGKLSVRYKGKADIIKFNGTKWVWDIIGVNISDKHLEDIEWLEPLPSPGDFAAFMTNSRDAFVKEINEQEWNQKLRTTAEDFLICFDQMRERIVGSSTYPVSGSLGKAAELIKALEEIDPRKSDGTGQRWYEYYGSQVQGEGKESYVHSASCYLAAMLAQQEHHEKIMAIVSQYNALPGSQGGEEIRIIKRGIHHVIAESEGLGYWHTCSGCHESEDGHDVGEYYYSETFKCKLGGGCHECGGIGAIWEYHEKEFQIDSSIEESGLKEGEDIELTEKQSEFLSLFTKEELRGILRYWDETANNR